MHLTRLIARIMHIPRRLVRESLMWAQLVRLSLINRYGRSLVTSPSGPVVSLTTFGKRGHSVYLAIESIADGTLRPSRLILWIDEQALFSNLPAALRRLQQRGLEIQSCDDYGPHKKYYPYVNSEDAFDTPFVTVDDDFLYPRYWLKRLVQANQEYPDTLNCYWSKVISINDHGIDKYLTWKDCSSTDDSFRHFGLCGMGAIFPPRLLMALKHAGAAFELCCPRADDIWLNVQALRSGHKVRQILPRLPYCSFHAVPGTQQIALSYENVTYGDGNDRQVTSSYTEMDIEVLRTGHYEVRCDRNSLSVCGAKRC
jgi:hypothetical protein